MLFYLFAASMRRILLNKFCLSYLFRTVSREMITLDGVLYDTSKYSVWPLAAGYLPEKMYQ